MLQTKAPVYSFEVISAGPDWLTATAPRTREGRAFREAGNRLLDEARAAGGDVKPAALRDYSGRRGDGFYVGERTSDRIIILTGQKALADFNKIAPHARNVSRLDLQVTLWTHGEQPNLAREGYELLKALPPQRGRPRHLTLIQSHPQGETLNVNRRTSDAYARVYDYASAHKAGTPQTLWRYEVEFKRHYAAHHTRTLLASNLEATHSNNLVHSWFEVRRLPLPWSKLDCRLSNELPLKERGRDCLGWLRECVSKTIARQINTHGIDAVLDALGLADKVQPIERRRRPHAA